MGLQGQYLGFFRSPVDDLGVFRPFIGDNFFGGGGGGHPLGIVGFLGHPLAIILGISGPPLMILGVLGLPLMIGRF